MLPLELIPLATELFVALRSRAAISVEIALRRSRRTFKRHEAAGGDVMRDVFIPRIVACALSVVALTAFANALSFAIAYLFFFGLGPDGAGEFTLAVAHVFSLPMVARLVVKCALFGILVAVVPIVYGLAVSPREDQVPVAVMLVIVPLPCHRRGAGAVAGVQVCLSGKREPPTGGKREPRKDTMRTRLFTRRWCATSG